MLSEEFEFEEEPTANRVFKQARSFFAHAALALLVWAALMALGYTLDPFPISESTDPFWHLVLLAFSLLVPMIGGAALNRLRQSEMASSVWLLGLIWSLIICLWVLDLPTGPNMCFQCDATEKMIRTFFSFPQPSGLLDNDVPFLCTWPSAALVGYSMGAAFVLRRKREE